MVVDQATQIRVERIEDRMDRVEQRQDKLEDAQQKQQIEFAETRVYVKETYKKIEEIAISIESLRNSTNERIEQQGRYYREELESAKKTMAKDAKDDGGEKQRTQILDFAKWVIGGVLALATATLAILQIYAKMGGSGS